MKIIIGADHAGYEVKERLKKFFTAKKIEYEDVGTDSAGLPDDYPDFAVKVAKKVAKSKDAKGILICGTGTGMVIAANKIKGIRAVAAYDLYSAEMSRKHNDANVLCLRGRYFSYCRIKMIVKKWLSSDFLGEERYKRRIAKIEKIR
jgi:ribose 5-phosphate isomerase B